MVMPQLILSVFFLALGFAMVKFPPRKINPWYGYRTQSSMKSQEAWDYAQRICSRKFILIGVVMLVVALVEWLVGLKPVWCALILTFSPLIAFPYLIAVVEKQLKRKFPAALAHTGGKSTKGDK
ncbi:MAG: SdpI family protein [Flavobacteriales bacterium]